MCGTAVNYLETYYNTKKYCDEAYLKLVIYNSQILKKINEIDLIHKTNNVPKEK